MTANPTASPEGSILTPRGWVTGKGKFAGHLISEIDGRTLAEGTKPLAKGRFAEIIGDLVHVDATVFLAAYRAIPRLYVITDATAAGMPDGSFEWGGHRVIKKSQRITLENGITLAGSAITMLDAFRNLIGLGLGLEQVVAGKLSPPWSPANQWLQEHFVKQCAPTKNH